MLFEVIFYKTTLALSLKIKPRALNAHQFSECPNRFILTCLALCAFGQFSSIFIHLWWRLFIAFVY